MAIFGHWPHNTLKFTRAAPIDFNCPASSRSIYRVCQNSKMAISISSGRFPMAVFYSGHIQSFRVQCQSEIVLDNHQLHLKKRVTFRKRKLYNYSHHLNVFHQPLSVLTGLFWTILPIVLISFTKRVCPAGDVKENDTSG
jgi:hypothetical protein